MKPIILDVENVKTFVGKKIKWNADAYYLNRPYEGVAVITEIVEGKRDEFSKIVSKTLKCETLSGDNLEYAFVADFGLEERDGEMFYANTPHVYGYTDADRPVCIQEIED